MRDYYKYNKEYNMFLISLITFTIIGFIIGFIGCYIAFVGVKI